MNNQDVREKIAKRLGKLNHVTIAIQKEKLKGMNMKFIFQKKRNNNNNLLYERKEKYIIKVNMV